ncbi:putative addiction module antidote protein [compost metagenome]
MQSGQKLRRFDVSAHLEDEEDIRAYLLAALEDATPGALWLALDNIAKARERIGK